MESNHHPFGAPGFKSGVRPSDRTFLKIKNPKGLDSKGFFNYCQTCVNDKSENKSSNI